MARGLKRSREISNLDDQLGGEEVAVSSSSLKRARQNRIRVPFTCATPLFELTKKLGFKSDGKTVEWLIQRLESDQDPHKFSVPRELLIVNTQHTTMNTPPPQEGRPRTTKDRHRLTEDGRDRRVRVPTKCLPKIVELTEKLRLKCDGETIEWLFTKYGLSTMPSQQAIQSTTTCISTSTITDNDSFNGLYLSPENDSSIPCHDDLLQNVAGHYEQANFMEPAFNANPNSLQYGSQPTSLPYYPNLPSSSAGGTANQLQFTSYSQQQTVTHPNSINFQSWLPNARGRMTVNDGLIREGSRSTFERPGQMGSLQYNPYLYAQRGYGNSSAVAGNKFDAGIAQNLSYTEQIWPPYGTNTISMPQSHCPSNQYSFRPYDGINSNGGAISMNSTFPQQQSWHPGVGGNFSGERPLNPYDNRYPTDFSYQQP